MVKLEYTFKNDTLFKMLFVKHQDLLKALVVEVPIMNQTIDAYRSITVTTEFREAERLHSKARHDEAQALYHAQQEGEQIGLQKGRQEVAQKALQSNMSIDDVVKITGLTIEEVKRLKETR